MNGYLVRTRENHQLVGIFVCERHDLFDHIDKVTRPDYCEHAVLPSGGIWWREPMNIIPLVGDEDNGGLARDLSLENSAISGSWERFFYGDGEWTAIPPPPLEISGRA